MGGEGGDDSARLWRHVADDLWGKDMTRALAPGGVLDGGDWGEGWQYGPLSVAEYALAARAIEAHGVDVPGIDRWLEALLVRFVHGLSPSAVPAAWSTSTTPSRTTATAAPSSCPDATRPSSTSAGSAVTLRTIAISRGRSGGPWRHD